MFLRHACRRERQRLRMLLGIDERRADHLRRVVNRRAQKHPCIQRRRREKVRRKPGVAQHRDAAEVDYGY